MTESGSGNDKVRATSNPARAIFECYDFFAALTEEQRQALVADAVSHKLGKDTLLLETGRDCDDVLFVGDGTVRVFVIGQNGREVTLYYIDRGGSCPINMTAALFRQPAAASAITAGTVQAVTVTGHDFRKLMAGSDALRDFAIAALAGRFEEIVGRIREITTRRVDERLAEFLLRAFDDADGDPPVIEATQQDIAMAIGSVREVVSRRLRELDQNGILNVSRGRMTLLDRKALAAAATVPPSNE